MSVPKVLLGDVVDILSGFAFKSELFNDSDGMPLIRIRDVVRGYSDTRYSGTYTDRYVVQDGEIVIGMDGNFNAARWSGGPALLNQRVCKISAKAGKLDDGYLFHFLPSVLKKIEDATPFVTVKHLSAGDLKAESIPLPPLHEQRRIAAILDQADALRAKRREALAQLDSLTQSIFIEMFGDPIHGESKAKAVSFEEITTRITYGFTSPMSHLDSGIPILTAKNVQQGYLDLENVHYADQTEFDALTSKSKPQRGDILITKDGTIGRTAVVDTEATICINQSVALVQLRSEKVVPTYVAAYLQSSAVQHVMKNMGKGNALAHLQITELAKLPIGLPPLAVQIEFSTRMESQSILLRKHEASANELNSLFSSLQHRAFRGEL